MRLAPRERDEYGKTVNDYVLERWIDDPPTCAAEEAEVADLWAQDFDRPPSTLRTWMSRWRNYKGTAFRGKIDGWPRVTHSILPQVIAAIKKANGDM
jgi:hypothetical protein